MIINWDSQGDILYEFIQIRKQIIAYQNNFIDRYGSFIKSSLNKSNHRIDDLNKLTNRLSTLIHSFKKFRVEDLSQTAMAVKTELKRILLGWDSDLCMIKSILNKDSGELLVPNQILMDSEDLNLNDKNNALKKYVSQTLPHFICEF